MQTITINGDADGLGASSDWNHSGLLSDVEYFTVEFADGTRAIAQVATNVATGERVSEHLVACIDGESCAESVQRWFTDAGIANRVAG
jgi:hypothetical protein